MSLPKTIQDSSRRKSIAKLTRSPLSNSPITSRSPSKFSNSIGSNVPFLKKDESGNEADSASHTSTSSNLIEEGAQTVDYPYSATDPKVIQQVSKHLPHEDSLQLEGGDITRDLYRLGQDRRLLRRSRSLSSTDWEQGRRGSTASSLNVPGGFRRSFVRNKYQNRNPNILTKNFVEFLSIYGHFAGEDLEDDDDIACHYKPVFDDETLPLYNRSHGTATNTKAYFLLLKAFVGTGVLFLPKAFSNGGLIFSVVVLLVFGFLSYWCYLVLAYSKMATRVSSFGDIGLKLYGKWLQRLILSSIVISQIGFVAAYIVFTSENLRAFFINAFNYKHDANWYIFWQVIILLPLSLIRDITKLSLLALLANLFIFIGLITIIYYIIGDLLELRSLGDGINVVFNNKDFSLFIGTAIFAFEGIGLIIPIQDSMVNPKDFPKVLFQVIVTISVIFIAIGALGYMTYGDKIETVIILNLPQDSIFVSIIQLLYSFAILLSSPIQLFPAIRLIESKLFNETGKFSLKVKWTKNLFRFFFVISTAMIAIVGGQNLDKFVSFVGCFACIPLVYMYPPILHLKSCCQPDQKLTTYENRKRFWLGILDYFLVLIGGVSMVYTTYNIITS
ncbi:uncharacterized protein PRCAT00005752001 [Priceomyces carsonii]|uniref:uncharacterized protein n=1 Tax=Priceomyces carsonii TaxID=28549 RepID=UPI002ED9DDAB|nr:unnamed protein product [Priceomyces carsonii]